MFNEIGINAQRASKVIARLSTDEKNTVLYDMSQELLDNTDSILSSNKLDLLNDNILFAIESSANTATDSCLPYKRSIASAGEISSISNSISGNFLASFSEAAGNKFLATEDNKPKLEIQLKYNYGSPVISSIQRISKPGRRIFSSAESLPKINNGLGIAIVSTPKGVMTDIDARKQKIGGEIICKVF